MYGRPPACLAAPELGAYEIQGPRASSGFAGPEPAATPTPAVPPAHVPDPGAPAAWTS
jgi:hypothetical protein